MHSEGSGNSWIWKYPEDDDRVAINNKLSSLILVKNEMARSIRNLTKISKGLGRMRRIKGRGRRLPR